jgi:hypothetical protein
MLLWAAAQSNGVGHVSLWITPLVSALRVVHTVRSYPCKHALHELVPQFKGQALVDECIS